MGLTAHVHRLNLKFKIFKTQNGVSPFSLQNAYNVLQKLSS